MAHAKTPGRQEVALVVKLLSKSCGGQVAALRSRKAPPAQGNLLASWRLGVIPLLLLAACNREPSFDERYARAAHDLREQSKAIDAELASAAATPDPAPASSPAAR
jgi:hypothetical protein